MTRDASPVPASSSVVEVAEHSVCLGGRCTGWLAWFRDEGLAGLADGSHHPHAHPGQTSPEVETAICELWRNHPRWDSAAYLGVGS